MHREVLSIIGGGVAALALAPAALGATFVANPGTLGAIPDGVTGTCNGGYGAPLDVTFTVDGLPSNTAISDVSVGFQMPPTGAQAKGHTWVGDLDVALLGPGGAPSQTIFSRLGAAAASACGDGSNIAPNATYSFSDSAPASPSFLAAAQTVTDSQDIPAGTYRASTPGGVANGNQNTLITPTFAGLTNPNGTWTLRFRDESSADTGSVSAATLTIQLAQRTLTVARAGSGAGRVKSTPAGIDCGGTCSKQVDDGTPITLSADPDPGSVFTGWSGGGCSGTGLCQVPMHADTQVTANFARPALTVAKGGSGGGSVTSGPSGIDCGSTCTAAFDDGTAVTLTAHPDAGSDFAGWSGGGCVGTGACQTSVSSDTVVTALFTTKPTLSVTKSGSGDGVVTSSPAGIDCGETCSGLFAGGSTVKLTASPRAGSKFTGWSGGGCSGKGSCRVSMSGAQAVQAGFESQPPPEVEITKAKIEDRLGLATFRYKALNRDTHSFKCALSKDGEPALFRLCTSPSRYDGLEPGRYTFQVRPVNADGQLATPAQKRFRIRP